MIIQDVSKRYIYLADLKALLLRLFPNDNCEIEETPLGYYKCTVPEEVKDVGRSGVDHEEVRLFGLPVYVARASILKMDDLREAIKLVRPKNIERKRWVPESRLTQLLTKDAVYTVLAASSIQKYRLEDIVRDVVRSGKKTLAILILLDRPELIVCLIEDDQLQHKIHVDSKLPYTLEKLTSLFNHDAFANKFYDKQWEFTAPVFSGSIVPRVLHDDVILPFIAEEPLESGIGGFGTVYVTTIEPSHQRLLGIKLARKEFKVTKLVKADYELELHNLSLLKTLKHPNLLKLLGAYTYRHKHNLLFPLASQGTLAMLFEEERPPHYQHDAAFLRSLAGLSSALRAVHDFTANSLDLQAIGCHHDLKPSNILIDQDTFILADFGISRFKEVEQGSATPFRQGSGDYLAPECHELEGDMTKLAITRAADRWSFGAIILELTVYMAFGTNGVKAFREERKFFVEGVNFFRFHRGPHRQQDAVTSKIAELTRSSSPAVMCLALLANRLLSLNPAMRPRACKIESTVRRILVEHMLHPIMDLFDEICLRLDDIQATVERQRLRSWKVICVSDHENDVEFWSSFSIPEFDSILQPLKELHDNLEVISTTSDGANYNIFRSVRVLNDSLLGLLPKYLQESIISHFEIYMLTSDDATFLQSLIENTIGVPLTRRAGQFAAMKQLSLLATGRDFQNRPNVGVGPTNLIGQLPVGDFYVAETTDTCLGGSRKVLIERKIYREECSSEEVATELLGRLEAVADLLGSSRSSRLPGVLPCSNYFLDVAQCEFGLLYDFPDTPSSGLKVITLQSLFDQGSSRQRLPPLGFRYRTAVELASSLLNFHKASWLHESISSSCVAVFHPPNPTWDAGEYQMYMLGFLHSRRNDPNAFTIGPPEDEHRMRYHHPTYLTDSPRYRAEFDYYSLGLVLLEIGLWKSLHVLSKSWEGSHDDLRVELLNKRVPQLAATVGEIYRDVVQTCLNGSFEAVGAEEGNPGAAELHYSFKRLVVDQLQKCSA